MDGKLRQIPVYMCICNAKYKESQRTLLKFFFCGTIIFIDINSEHKYISGNVNLWFSHLIKVDIEMTLIKCKRGAWNCTAILFLLLLFLSLHNLFIIKGLVLFKGMQAAHHFLCRRFKLKSTYDEKIYSWGSFIWALWMTFCLIPSNIVRPHVIC